MTSDVVFPGRFTEIDELTRPDHSWLTDDDRCYFLGEYTARQGYSYSPTNNLILNFKKEMDRREKPEWRYKEQAIQRAASAFRRALGTDPLSSLVFVPIPPSKTRNDPLYDDRVTRMLRAIGPDETVDEALTIPEPAFIAIVDDVLTTGAHFRAASEVLTARFPAVRIVGLFIARRVPEDV